MSPIPGYDKFILGNTDKAMGYGKLRRENAGKKIVKHIVHYFMDNIEGRADSYEAAKHPVVVNNTAG